MVCMRYRRWMIAALATAATLMPVAATTDAQARDGKIMVDQEVSTQTIALVGGNVVDVDTGNVMIGATVIVTGGRISAVGPAASITIPPDAKQVSMTGRWLIPGLMNMHTHYGLKLPGAAGAALVNETDPQQVLRMAGNARKSLLAGVTTTRLHRRGSRQ